MTRVRRAETVIYALLEGLADGAETMSLSSVVITFNRIDVVETCLRSARIADELIVVDKGSTDGTADIGRRMADKFVQVPWSPTVEETRSGAVALATSPWVLMLDDDECLNATAMDYVLSAVETPQASIYYLPYRHHILGRHDERAYYWPEYRPALFRRGAIRFNAVVHGGVHPMAEDRFVVQPETGAAIMHLSHRDAATWIEKTNRYTSDPNRVGTAGPEHVTPQGMMALLQTYLDKVPSNDPGGYLAAVAALRGVYDIVDAIKHWENQRGPGGFADVCRDLNNAYDRRAARKTDTE